MSEWLVTNILWVHPLVFDREHPQEAGPPLPQAPLAQHRREARVGHRRVAALPVAEHGVGGQHHDLVPGGVSVRAGGRVWVCVRLCACVHVCVWGG